jgi:hypothetical protein
MVYVKIYKSVINLKLFNANLTKLNTVKYFKNQFKMHQKHL